MSWPAEGQTSDLSAWVGNGRGSLDWVASGGRLWPVSLGDARQGRDATWLTSLVSALVGTPKEEAAQPDTFAGRLLRTGLGIAERAAIAAGADVFVTGEISEPQAHYSAETGVAFIAVGHHASERYGVQALASHLAAEFGLTQQFIDIPNPA